MTNKIKKWAVRQSLDHPKRTILILILFTAIFAFGLKWLVIEDDLMKILPQDMETVKTWNSIKEEFGSTEMMFIAFGKRGESVYNSKTFSKMWDLCEEIEMLPNVYEVLSISTNNRMDSEDGFLEVSNLQPGRDLTEKEIRSIRQYIEENSALGDRFIGINGDFLNIIVKPIPNSANTTFARSVVEITKKHLPDYEIHYGGQVYLMGTMPNYIRGDISTLMRVGIMVMAIILLLSLRSVPAVLMNFVVIIFSLVTMAGFMGWVYALTGSDKFLFSLLNTSMPMVLLTIANSDGVHVITKFFKKIRITKDVRESISITMDSLLLPIFLTSITTIAAFMSMIFAPLQQMVGYGIAISVGIAWAWILSSLFLPAMLSLKKWNMESRAIKRAGAIERVIDYIGKHVMTYPKIILGSALLLIGIAAFGVQLLNMEVNLMTFFERGTEVRDSLEFMDDEMSGTMDMELRIEGDIKDPSILKDMEMIQEYLEKHPDVSATMSIADIIKIMHKTVEDNDPSYEVIPDSRGKVNNLFTLYSMSGDPEDFESLVDYDYEIGLITTLMRTVSTTEIAEFVNDTEKFLEKNIENDLGISMTGMLVVFRDLVGKIINSSFISIFASIILICIIASIFFKRFLWGIIAITPLTSSVILTFGLMGWFGIDFNHITAILSSVIIGVGVDFAVHYISQFKRISSRTNDHRNLTNEVIDDVGYPIILDSASNMAFGALMASTFIPIQHIGGLMVFAMLSTSLGTLTLMASIVELSKKRLIER
jgi:predicted RND superfamily exporter protein